MNAVCVTVVFGLVCLYTLRGKPGLDGDATDKRTIRRALLASLCTATVQVALPAAFVTGYGRSAAPTRLLGDSFGTVATVTTCVQYLPQLYTTRFSQHTERPGHL